MADYLESLLAETEKLRAPIAGDSPGGADVSLEPDFEKIKAEIDKLTSLTGGQVDWRSVSKGAEELLSTKTKDLRLGLWMACGELERGGWKGFARALVVCRAIVIDFWDTMQPVRPKARANIVGWFGERATPQIAALRVDRDVEDPVRACEQLLGEIDGALSEKLGDAYGGMGSARNTMRARVRDIPPPPPPPEEKPAASSEWADDDDAPAPAADTSNGAAAGGVALSTRAEDAGDTARAAGEALVNLARAMRMQDPTRAWAYRLHRTGIWLPFDAPPTDALPAPAPELRAGVRTLFAQARWAELLSAAEEASATSPMWLDAHRFAAIATERLGLAYADAREVVGRDASDIARRWPFIVERAFDDGTPHADDETRAWLREEAERWQVVAKRGEAAARDEDQKLKKRFDAAQDLVARGHHAEGLALAAETARRAASPRERFRADLAVSELAMSVGAFDVARPLLDGLFAISEAQRLDAWDPALSATLYAGLVKCLEHEAKEGREGANDRRAQVFERLCRVDPGAAIRARTGGAQGNGSATISSLIGQVFGRGSDSSHSSSSGSGGSSGATAPSAPAAPASPTVQGAPAKPESEWADDD
jgi:type VI secretion system protein VasJ